MHSLLKLTKPKLIVGLGNPGLRYRFTRHNLGALAIEATVEKFGAVFKEEAKFIGSVAKILVEHPVHFLLPLTYMNESGRSVKKVADYYGVPPQEILVVSDDVYLDFGVMRMRLNGSSGGHNGLKSVAQHLGTENFPRLKMGVGRRPTTESGKEITLSDYVLSAFNKEELVKLPGILNQSTIVLEQLIAA